MMARRSVCTHVSEERDVVFYGMLVVVFGEWIFSGFLLRAFFEDSSVIQLDDAVEWDKRSRQFLSWQKAPGARGVKKHISHAKHFDLTPVHTHLLSFPFRIALHVRSLRQ